MPPLPPEVVAVIESCEGEWSDHALDGAEQLGLHWEDVVSVAQTSEGWKRTRDPRGAGSYVDAALGRDTRGRRIYMAGKVRTRAAEALWYVITIHEAE
jgi:SH3-like domain-containing protein